jgi:hypothetical protein
LRPVLAQPQQLWSDPGIDLFSPAGSQGFLLSLRPTVKPVAMIVDALPDSSLHGQIALGGALDRAMTRIAAEDLGGICRGRCDRPFATSPRKPESGHHERAAPEYQIGYGRPPLQTRFPKGQSGNPKGRLKGSRALASIWLRAMNEKVTINENGQRRRIAKQEAAIKQLANKAASGDKRAIQDMVRFQTMSRAETHR